MNNYFNGHAGMHASSMANLACICLKNPGLLLGWQIVLKEKFVGLLFCCLILCVNEYRGQKLYGYINQSYTFLARGF